MQKKSVIISSSGLKNIALNKYQEEEDFIFVFGEEKFQMNSFFAEFISPVVSHMHQTDPTINTIDFEEIAKVDSNDFKKLSKSIITPDTISLLIQISSGYCIEINEEQAMKLSILSNILGNTELYQKLNELFPSNFNEDNVNTYLKNIENFYHFPSFSPCIDFQRVVSFIARHFYAVDIEEFLKLSRKIQHMIISDSELQIENEDCLLDIVLQIIESENNQEEIDDIMFLELIELGGLSEDKFLNFVAEFDFNKISGILWRNLCQCFFTKKSIKQEANIKNIKNRRRLKGIIVSGYDESNSLGTKPTSRNDEGFFIINQPVKLPLDPTSLQSYYIYNSTTILVTKNGLLKVIGFNDGRIGPHFQEKYLFEFSEFSKNDERGYQLTPISAVCSRSSTLYMFSKVNHSMRQLVLCHSLLNNGQSIFLNTDNRQPVALFGGIYHLAAILYDGDIYFINNNLLVNLKDDSAVIISLPFSEKASSIALCQDFIFVLSMNGRVYSSPIDKEKNDIKISLVKELFDKEIVCISGTAGHCLAVSKDGRVFGHGSNEYGQLGMGEDIKSVSSFTEISSLGGYEIRAAYAGFSHSLFETNNGKILSCGYNKCGELLLSCGPSENVYLPTETTIKNGSTFCIAGCNTSSVFVGVNPPPKTPNMRIYDLNT